MKPVLRRWLKLGLAFSAAAVFMQSCLKSDEPGLPAEVVRVLQVTGHNRVELIKALAKYIESEDTTARNALFFLIGNMERHYSVEYELTDSAGKALSFEPLAYSDYRSMLRAWDSLAALPGGMIFSPRRYTLDRDTITSGLLLNTIELAISSRKTPWAKNIPDSIFLRYVLPYRVANEDLEDWRPLLKNYFSKISGDAEIDNADQLADVLNRLIDSLFFEDNRLIKNANVSLPSKIIQAGRGNPRDLAIFRVMALRSLGIPATLDYSPWISDSLNSIWFASYYNQNGHWKPLLPKKFDQQILSDSRRIPKVYRRIFHTLDSSLFAIKETKKTTPPFLGHFHYLDVTHNYLPVRTVSYSGLCPDQYIYLSVWNGKNWKPVDWAKCNGNAAIFYNIGKDVNYEFTWLEEQGDYYQIRLLSGNSQTNNIR